MTQSSITALGFGPSGRRLAFASSGKLSILDLTTESLTEVQGLFPDVAALALSSHAIAYTLRSPDRTLRNSGSFRVTNIEDGAHAREFSEHSSAVMGLAFSPDGEYVASGEFHPITRLWTLRSGCPQQRIPSVSTGLRALNFRADGRWLLAVSAASIQISDAISASEGLRLLPPAGYLLAAGFGERGDIIAVGDDEGLKLWTSPPLLEPIQPTSKRATLHILSIGLNAHNNPHLRLRFAERDAHSIAEMLERNRNVLPYDPQPTRVTGACTTRTEILAALDSIRSAVSQDDALFLYLAGHGKMTNDGFVFFPDEVASSDGRESGTSLSLTAHELGAKLAEVSVERKIVVVDACESGASVSQIEKAILETASKGTSVQVLAASAASEDAMEVEELGHGVLTAAFLSEFQAAIASGGEVNAGFLLDRVAKSAARLARKYDKSGPQVPVYRPLGNDFTLISRPNGDTR
jgi:hypothetical protein